MGRNLKFLRYTYDYVSLKNVNPSSDWDIRAGFLSTGPTTSTVLGVLKYLNQL